MTQPQGLIRANKALSGALKRFYAYVREVGPVIAHADFGLKVRSTRAFRGTVPRRPDRIGGSFSSPPWYINTPK